MRRANAYENDESWGAVNVEYSEVVLAVKEVGVLEICCLDGCKVGN